MTDIDKADQITEGGGDPIKSGSRNNADDRRRIREVREHARAIQGITTELEPTEDDDEMLNMEERIIRDVTGKALRVKLAGHVSVQARPALGDAVKRMRPMSEMIDPGYEVLGVPFGGPYSGRDLDGEAFIEDTQIWLTPGDVVNLTYYHGFGPDDPDTRQNPPVLIGRAIYLRMDGRGHWFAPMLDPDEPLAQRVMVQPDRIRASSGAVGHLCRMGRAGIWRSWPLGELALFDINEFRIPSNDYAVCEPKTMPEMPGEDDEDEEGDALKMTENTQSAPQIDYAALAAALRPMVADEIKAVMDAEPTVKAPPPYQGKGVNLNLQYGHGDPDPVEDYISYIKTGQSRIKKHTVVADLPVGPNGQTIKAALQEGADDEGGYLVPAGELGSIIAKRDEAALLGRVGAAMFTTDRDVYNIPTEGTAMTRFVIVAEEGDVSAAENEPTFAQAACTLYKFQKMIKVSEEILEDYNSGLEAFLTNGIGRAWAITENYYMQLGNGTTAPQGVFVGGTAGLTLDAAATIAAAEVPELIGKLKEAYLPGAVMIMRRTTKAYLAGLTGNQFVFAQAAVNPVMDAVSATIGYPVYGTEDAAAIGAGNKSMLFGNFGFYGWVRNRSLQIKRFVELYGATGQIGIRATFRAGAKVLQAEALQYATHPTA